MRPAAGSAQRAPAATPQAAPSETTQRPRSASTALAPSQAAYYYPTGSSVKEYLPADSKKNMSESARLARNPP